MSIPFNINHGSPPRGRLIFIALVSLLGLSHIAHAQTTPAAVLSMKQVPAQAPAFRSALEGYKPYTDDGAPEWKKANDAVGQIGGWRSYAREAQGNGKDEQKTDQKGEQKSPSQTLPAKPEPAGTPPNPDAGHAGHAKP